MSAFFLCDKIEKQDKIEKSGASDESDTPPAKGEDKYSQLIICAVRHSLEGGIQRFARARFCAYSVLFIGTIIVLAALRLFIHRN